MPEPVEVPTVSQEPETKSEITENTADPEVLFTKGKRNLLCGEIQKAVNLLQEASRLQAQKHGELADACAESYYLYGVALLELSRMESGVLGNALQGIATQEAGEAEEKESEEDKQFTEQDNYTDAEKEKISDEVMDAMLEKPSEKSDNDLSEKKEEASMNGTSEQTESTAAEETAQSEEGKSAECVEGKVEEDKKPATETEEDKVEAKSTDETAGGSTEADKEEDDAEAMEEANEGEDNEAEDEEEELDVEAGNTAAADKSTVTEDEDEVSNLQVAWEMLELAKNIYKKHDSSEMKLRQADCLLKLGEIGIESEQYKQAAEDINECLRLQVDAGIPSSDRRLAETHYQLGLAYSHTSQYSDALTNFRKAVDIVQSRITDLTKKCEGGSTTVEEEGVSTEDRKSDDNAEGEQKKEPSESENTLKQMTEELNELRALVPEIMNKIEDVEEDLRNADKVKTLISEGTDVSTEIGFQSSSTQDSSDKDDKPVTNVSHLVRRKRKPEEEEDDSKPQSSDDVKKLKTSEDCTYSTVDASAESVDSSNDSAAASAVVTEETTAASTADTDASATVTADVTASSESVDTAGDAAPVIGDIEMAPAADSNEQPATDAAVVEEMVQEEKQAANENNEAEKEAAASEDQTEQMNVDTVLNDATPSAE